MMYRIRRHILLAAAIGVFAQVLPADFDAGLKAYNARDYATALKEWQPLADSGAPHAAYNLGLMYARGQGVPADCAKAAQYYREAAENGVVAAQYNLGLLYTRGDGVPKDQAQAAQWFLKAAQQGDMRAAASLGDVYEGSGAIQNYAEALRWYRKAANAGVADAQFGLGLMYDIGQGVPQDFAEALKWYQKAAEQGDGGALCNIGILYYNGQGVPIDRVEAHRYFLLAIARGDPRGSNLLELTMERLDKKQLAKAINEARDWLGAHHFDRQPTADPQQETAVATAKSAADSHEGSGIGAAAPQPVPAAPVAHPTTAAPASDRAAWAGVERVVAVGDIHGGYSQLVSVLRSARLIDEKTDWAGGKAHLVQTGNILDGSGDSRKVMDLLIKLQKQAEQAGGYVHVLPGNHEIMDLYGDLRYVSPADFAAFATPDSAKRRGEEYENFVKAAGPFSHITREEWDRQHPLGYFEQRAAFGPDGPYGKWLRSLNTVIRIDDTLFSHAGLSGKYARMPIDEINRRVRAELNHLDQARGGIAMDREGPLWYAGLATGDERQLLPAVEDTLKSDGVKREVIGNTNANAAVTPRFGGKVVMIAAIGAAGDGGSGPAGFLEISDGVPFAFD